MKRSKAKPEDHSRRIFLKRGIAFILGSSSAGAAVYLALKGAKIDPFLSRASKNILRRFGTPVDLLGSVQLSGAFEEKMSEKVKNLKSLYDKSGRKSGDEGFIEFLKRSIKIDFRTGRTVMVDGWILSETEFGIFLYNKKQKYLG